MGTRMAIEASDIKWDTDGEPVSGLPETMTFEIELSEEDPSEDEINEAATEHMSGETGWCVESLSLVSRKLDDVPAPSI